MSTWTDTDDYTRAFAPTDDPRLLAVIERDPEPHAPDGDALAPAYWIEYSSEYRARVAGDTYQDDESEALAARWVQARSHFRYTAGYRYDGLSMAMIVKSEAMLERWARVFYETTFEFVEHPEGDVLLLNTPSYRAHIGSDGAEAAAANFLEGDVAEWRAYLDGDVYGIGYAVNEERVMDDGEPVDLDDFEVTIECWGFSGEDYAKESAASFGAGKPDLADMLPL